MEKLAYSKKALGLIPLFFLIHNIEEIIMAKNYTPLFELTDFTYTPFALGVVMLSAVIILLFRLSEYYKFGKYFLQISITLSSSFLEQLGYKVIFISLNALGLIGTKKCSGR